MNTKKTSNKPDGAELAAALPKRKTHTSSAVKNRYNAKTYTQIAISVKKDKAAAYKAKCDELGITYSEPLHRAIDEFLSK